MKNKISKKSVGFTLIEMLIVIAIIAILSSVFLVGLRGFRSSAYDSRRISDLQKVQSYLETLYNVHNRQYPEANNADWNTWSKTNFSSLNISLPQDPVSGRSYVYCVSGDKQSYVLGAELSSQDNSALRESYHGDIYSDCTTKGSDNTAFYCGSNTYDRSQQSDTPWLCVRF
ncbi:prepilin-type N-terminal cleavage/methylation domain-containing protein [Candidatus Wolfebacteria bacterium]|nr:prepilin-type N-terminal cleavage/methylation domain-containing protein [Candidatus Wolfebacteria bacterium]